MDGQGTSPRGRCEGIPDPSEVSTLGKLRVFLISYNLITRNDIITDMEMLTGCQPNLNFLKMCYIIQVNHNI
jgi:hypothetical protein